jgi:hypothetical protein
MYSNNYKRITEEEINGNNSNRVAIVEVVLLGDSQTTLIQQ